MKDRSRLLKTFPQARVANRSSAFGSGISSDSMLIYCNLEDSSHSDGLVFLWDYSDRSGPVDTLQFHDAVILL